MEKYLSSSISVFFYGVVWKLHFGVLLRVLRDVLMLLCSSFQIKNLDFNFELEFKIHES